MLKKQESKELQALSKALNTIGRKDASKKVASLLKVAYQTFSTKDGVLRYAREEFQKLRKGGMVASKHFFFTFRGDKIRFLLRYDPNSENPFSAKYKLGSWYFASNIYEVNELMSNDKFKSLNLNPSETTAVKDVLEEVGELVDQLNSQVRTADPQLGQSAESAESVVSSERAFATQGEADAALAKLNASGKLQEGQDSPDQQLLINYLKNYAIDKKIYITDGNTAFRFNSAGDCVYQQRGTEQITKNLPESLKMFNIVFKTVFGLARYRTDNTPFQIKIMGFRPQEGVQSLDITAETADAKDSLFASSSLRKRRLMKIADFSIPQGIWDRVNSGETSQPKAAPSRTRSTSRPKPYEKTQELIKQVAKRKEIDISDIADWRLSDGQWGEGTSDAYNRVTNGSTTATSRPNPAEAEQTLNALLEAPSEDPPQADAPLDEPTKELLKKYWLAKPSKDQERLFANRDGLSDDLWTYVRSNKETIDTILSDDQFKARAQQLNEAYNRDNRGGLLYLYLTRKAESEDTTDEFASSDFIMATGESDFNEKMRVFINKNKDSRLYKELFYDLSDGQIEFLWKRDGDPRSGDDRWGDSLTNEEKRNLERAIKESRLEEDVQRALLDSIKDYRRVQRRRRRKSRRFRDR